MQAAPISGLNCPKITWPASNSPHHVPPLSREADRGNHDSEANSNQSAQEKETQTDNAKLSGATPATKLWMIHLCNCVLFGIQIKHYLYQNEESAAKCKQCNAHQSCRILLIRRRSVVRGRYIPVPNGLVRLSSRLRAVKTFPLCRVQ